MQKVKAFIGVGSNLGDKRKYIEDALDLLSRAPEVKLERVASYYRTEPVGYTDQDWFLNTVAEISTSLKAHELLNLLLSIENKLGRKRKIHWGPRVIDLDLLLYGSERVNDPVLVVPHPRMCERAFVVVPLAELNPEIILPDGNKAGVLAPVLAGKQKIIKISD